MRPNAKLMQASLTGALGGLLYGFDTVVISGIIDSVAKLYSLSPTGVGLTVAASPVGNILGCFCAGVIGQRIGTRAALRIAAAIYLCACLAAAFSIGWPMLLAARFVGGMAIGACSVLGPVYITELSPAQWRGRLVGLFQINVVSGILIGLISNYFVRLANLGALEWHVMLGVAAVPTLLFLILLLGIPLSPRWSVSRNQIDEALNVLSLVGAPDPNTELADIQAALQSEHATVHEPVFQWKYRYPLFLAIAIGAFNQLTGINAIFSYVHSIFTAAGFSQLSSDSQGIAIGATNLLFTLVGMAMIDKFGRKSLLIVGAIGTALCLSGVARVFYSNSHQSALLALLVGFIAFFALSQGLVVFVYIGEVFPNAVRSKGQGVGNASLATINTTILFTFPILAHHFNAGAPFVFFAAATVVQLIVVTLFFPETKGQTLEQLQRKLMRT
ncbi:MAG TPA: sugar porter family MFS transporter [Terracidiphilus sp.]|nr:sugar porter family MFS transporter [Terracidiphilus sp.]